MIKINEYLNESLTDTDDKVAVARMLGVREDVAELWVRSQVESKVDEDGVVYFYGPIVDNLEFVFAEAIGFDAVDGKTLSNRLESAAENRNGVTLRINSPGGDVRETAVVRSAMKGIMDAGKTIDIEVTGMAGSAASLIALSGGDVTISDMGEVFIHRPYVSRASGNADVMRMYSDTLNELEKVSANIYDARLDYDNLGVADALELMANNGGIGTSLSASQAIESGFAKGLIGDYDKDDDKKKSDVSSEIDDVNAVEMSIGLARARLDVLRLRKTDLV